MPRKATPKPEDAPEQSAPEQLSTLTLSNHVNRYLIALEATTHKPRGRTTKEYVERRLQELGHLLNGESEDMRPTTRLDLIQERISLRRHAVAWLSVDRLTELEQAFIKYGPMFAERKGISYEAFREVGVPASVLREAGIAR